MDVRRRGGRRYRLLCAGATKPTNRRAFQMSTLTMKKHLFPLLGVAALGALNGCSSGGGSQPQIQTPTAGMVSGPFGTRVPAGFKIEVVADRFTVPRRIAFAPGATAKNYDILIAESKADRVSLVRIEDGKTTARTELVKGLNQPYGLAFLNDSLYIGNTDAVVKVPYKAGETQISAPPQRVAALTEGGYNQHWTRNLLANRDKTKLFVTVGSSCNTCEESDPQRAAVSVMNPDGSGKRVYASGLRNPVGLALRPGSDELWTVVNERDNLGDDVPPDYLTKVGDGKFYGWPYAYTDIEGKIHPDPTFGDKNPAKVAQTTAPSFPVQAHSAALGLAFYPTSGGTFGADYNGDAFLAFHGSWNRSQKTGYKIVRVHFEGGKPAKISDFVTGLDDNGGEVGRPVDVQVAPDGSLLFTDDGAGRLWRVSRA